MSIFDIRRYDLKNSVIFEVMQFEKKILKFYEQFDFDTQDVTREVTFEKKILLK